MTSRIYHAPRGQEASVKPLALLRERLRCSDNPFEAKKDFYGEFERHWAHWHNFKCSEYLFWRYIHHYTKVIAIAEREVYRYGKRAA